MLYIRNKKSKNFSKDEVEFLNNFRDIRDFISFSNAFKNLYNKVVNFAEGKQSQNPAQENKSSDNQTNKVQETNQEINSIEDLLDPEYLKQYAALRADSDLGRESGNQALSKYVDRYAKYITDKDKRSKGFDGDPIIDYAKNLVDNNTYATARNALKKYPSQTMDLDQKRLADQIEDTRVFLFGGKLLPTPENVMDSVRSGGLLKRIDWSKPEEVKRYQSILDYYNNIYKRNPEDLKALSWNNNKRGNTAYA